MDRFDANSLLYVTRAMDYFDLAPPGGTLRDAFARQRGGLPPPDLLVRLALSAAPPRSRRRCGRERAGRSVGYREIPSDNGHDAFLLEHEAQAPIIRAFLGEGAG